MILNDQKFEALLKKSKKKRTWQMIATAFITIAVVVGGAGSVYAWYYNDGPFQGTKVAGLPDNQLAEIKGTGGHLNLLFRNAGGIQYNAPKKVKKISIYLDHYEKDKKVASDEIFSTMLDGNEEVKSFSHDLYWGVVEDGSTLGELRLSLVSGDGSVSIGTNSVKLSKYAQFSGAQGTGSLEGVNREFPINQPIILSKWVKSMEMRVHDAYSENVRKEELIKNKETLLLYVKFEV